MNGQPNGRRGASARAAAVATCSVVAALVGAAALAAPADASTMGDAGSCITATANPITDLATATGLTDAVRTTVVDTTGLVGCATGAVLGTGSTPTPAPTHQPVVLTQTPPTADSGLTPPPVGTDGAGTTTSASSKGVSDALDSLTLTRSSNVVYPVKDGYLDAVKVKVMAIDADGDAVPVQGRAVLRSTDRSVKTWTIDGAGSVISWNGRVGGAIRTGLYTLEVTAHASSGPALTSSTRIRVLSKHLLKRALVIRTNVGASTVAAELPRQLLKAYSMGRVSVRVRTEARVTGRARLVFSNDGKQIAVPLRNGVHTTKDTVLAPGFSRVRIIHDWKKGAARLTSLHAIWTYYTLA